MTPQTWKEEWNDYCYHNDYVIFHDSRILKNDKIADFWLNKISLHDQEVKRAWVEEIKELENDFDGYNYYNHAECANACQQGYERAIEDCAKLLDSKEE